MGVEIESERVNVLAYAHGVDLIDRTIDGIRGMFEDFQNAANTVGLLVNVNKTELMHVSENADRTEHTEINYINFRVCRYFKYLM